jgi:hypothetical protein
MSGNSRGNYRSTRANRMRAFDKLPPEARAALANAVASWAPQPILTDLRRGWYKNGAEIAAEIACWDRQELAKREDQRRRGVGPYKGPVERRR